MKVVAGADWEWTAGEGKRFVGCMAPIPVSGTVMVYTSTLATGRVARSCLGGRGGGVTDRTVWEGAGKVRTNGEDSLKLRS